LTYAIFAIPLAAALAIFMGGCAPQDSSGAAQSTTTRPAQPYETVAAQGKGFTVGAMMSAQPVYVLFDPQCPHCGRLWEASLPLHGKVKFVWVPVAIMNPKSASQGAALLGATDPAALMSTHEKSLLGGSGGISASASAPHELAQALKDNTALFNSLGVASVPYLLARHLRTGEVVTHSGALDTPALGKLLGLELN
jgi:thiol:disulfide interchange protein DsbG